MELNLAKAKKIYFIGIGGIGVSALARMMLERGKSISGSDRTLSQITDGLAELGARVDIGEDVDNVPEDADLVVYTPALSSDNVEMVRAHELNIPTLSYPEALGAVSSDYRTVAITGTHGKTTTTGMTGTALIDAGRSPTVIVGSLLSQYGSNYVRGDSDLLVVEACEYRKHFLNLSPYILAITNIDADHLDYFKDLEGVKKAFAELVSKLAKTDYLVCNPSHPNVEDIVALAKCTVIDYCDYYSDTMKLSKPGDHNFQNAAVALAVVDILGVDKKVALYSLASYEGTWRRFEYKGKSEKGSLIYDDYAHHPTEVKVTLNGARQNFKDKKIIAVFQPHLYSRTKLLLDEFSGAFREADEVVILPIYAAREKPDVSISSNILADAISKHNTVVKITNSFDEAESYLRKHDSGVGVIITMGAGDVFEIGEKLALQK